MNTANLSVVFRLSFAFPPENILKPSSNWSLFKPIISDQTLIKLKYFLPIHVHFNGQTFSSVFEQFSFTSKFFWLKMQISTIF